MASLDGESVKDCIWTTTYRSSNRGLSGDSEDIEKIRVLHLGKYDFFTNDSGGIETYLTTLTQNLQYSVIQRVLVFSHKADTITEKRLNHVDITMLPVHFVLGTSPASYYLLFYLNQIINSFKPDIIHAHMPGLMPLFMILSLKKRGFIVNWHADVDGTAVAQNIAYPIYRLLEQKLLSNADAVIVTSPHYLYSSRSLRRWKKKCHIIPIGINYPFNKADTTLSSSQDLLRKDSRLPEEIKSFIGNKRIVLSVGRMAYYKGYPFLIEAMDRLLRRGCSGIDDCLLVIAGEGRELIKLKRKVDEMRLQKNILLPGRISESVKHDLLSVAEIFCMPSIDRAEAFGISLLEAMAHKKPIITTHVNGSGMNYINIHGRTGLTVPPSDSRSLANAILFLLRHQDVAKLMGINGFHRMKAQFSSIFNAGRIFELYQSTIQKNSQISSIH